MSRAFPRPLPALILAAATVQSAHAVPFGSTTIGTGTTIPPCTSSVNTTSMEVDVDVPSRLLVTISGETVSADATNVYALSYQSQLFDAAGDSLLARSQGGVVVAAQYLGAMADSEVLSAPDLSQAYTLAAGHYTLALNVESSGSCSGAGIYIGPVSLTYVLLSSTFDRIYANGFAMGPANAGADWRSGIA